MREHEPLLLDHIETPLGRFALVADTEGRLRAAGWSARHARMERMLGARQFVLTRNPGGLGDALRAYFAGDLGALDGLPVAFEGTDFQRAVWEALREIPCGATRSYTAIAQRIGRPNAVRAVGAANGANPVAVVVPCHRVIGASGSLTGYGGGLDRKRWLLAHEGGRTNSRRCRAQPHPGRRELPSQ